MRKSFILFLILCCFTGCGTDVVGCPEGFIRNDQGECVEISCETNEDCEANQACVLDKCIEVEECSEAGNCMVFGEECINGKCIQVLDPCEDNNDCSIDYNCDHNRCVYYMEYDKCYGEECSGECGTCGQYTTCVNGTCDNACEVWNNRAQEERTDVCNSYTDCAYCECVVIEEGSWNNGTCLPHEDSICYPTSSKDGKKIMETNCPKGLVKDNQGECVEIPCRVPNELCAEGQKCVAGKCEYDCTDYLCFNTRIDAIRDYATELCMNN